MNFKLPNYNFSEDQFKMLEDIQLSQKNILEKFTELNNRIAELEKSQRNFSLAIQKKSEEKIEKSFLDKLKLNIFLSIAATLIICAVLIIFGWHFGDIPSQTQAVNNYIYNKIVTESAVQNAP